MKVKKNLLFLGPTLSKRLDIVAVRQLRNESHITRSKILSLCKQLRRLSCNDRFVSRSNALFAMKDCGIWSSEINDLGSKACNEFLSHIISEIILQSVHPQSSKVDIVLLCSALCCLSAANNIIDSLELSHRVADFSNTGLLSLEELTEVFCGLTMCLETAELSGEYTDPPELVKQEVRTYLKDQAVACVELMMIKEPTGMNIECFLVAVQCHPVVKMFL